MDWVERVKYLGCYFRSRTGEVDTANEVGKFYNSFNNILNVLGKQRKEMLAVYLVKTYCIPYALYGCEVWSVRPADITYFTPVGGKV